MMPGINGFELTQLLKTNAATNHIPIVLLTALSDQSNRLQGLQSKADDYLVKPFDVEELNIIISNLLEVRAIIKAKYLESIFNKPFRQNSLIQCESDQIESSEENKNIWTLLGHAHEPTTTAT